MKPFRAVGINFIAGISAGLLVVLSTPIYVAELGLERFGLIGFWQLLLLVSAIFDFGLGASLMREFSRFMGTSAPNAKYWELLLSVERVYIFVAVLIGGVIYLISDWLSTSWVRLVDFSTSEASFAIKLMAVSVAFQFLTTLYTYGLFGLQMHGVTNICQILGNTLKYAGGVVVVSITSSFTLFFVFQALSAIFICSLTRRQIIKGLGPFESSFPRIEVFELVGRLSKFSTGMFLTAMLGLLLANADRIILSKNVQADDFGRYTLAFTAVGLLQMIVLGFYRAYFPKFSELHAARDENGLKSIYYQGCSYVGAIIVPAAVVAIFFAPELLFTWAGYQDDEVTNVFRMLVIGTLCSGLMWLPAGLQQAIGWTRLHNCMMALALAVGVPALLYGIRSYGIVGATAIVLVHGAIEITFGLWLMNRVLFPRQNLHWYMVTLACPLFVSLPLAVISVSNMPLAMGRIATLAWIILTGCLMLLLSFLITLLLNRGLFKRIIDAKQK